jgi:hypothetical protein
MNTKFKIGEEVFFMRYDVPSKGIIKGIAIIEGAFKESSFEKTGTVENPSINYSIEGSYTSVEEHKVFATKEELVNSLFSNL